MKAVLIGCGKEFPHLKATCTLIQDNGLNLLIDCGEPEGAPSMMRELGRHGVAASDVEAILLTHLHHDHCCNIDLFPKATVLVHIRELEFFRDILKKGAVAGVLEEALKGHFEYIHTFFLRSMLRTLAQNWPKYGRLFKDSGRLMALEGDASVAPGLIMFGTSGHSQGHMSVVVKSDAALVFAGDAVSSLTTWQYPDRVKRQVCWNYKSFLSSHRRIRRKGKIIIPGHGLPFHLEEDHSAARLCSEETLRHHLNYRPATLWRDKESQRGSA